MKLIGKLIFFRNKMVTSYTNSLNISWFSVTCNESDLPVILWVETLLVLK